MFERFTDRARRVVVLAQEEARLLDHDWIGTEHLLLGLIQEQEGVAARALDVLGVSLETVRSEIEKAVKPGKKKPQSMHIPFTPRAKKILELSLREALQLGHNYIGTEHLLLGLVREGEGVGAQVLAKLGADRARARQAVLQLLSGEPGEAVPADAAQITTPPAAAIGVGFQMAPRSRAPKFVGVVAIGRQLEAEAGVRLVLLALEVWSGWFDLRFAALPATGAKMIPPQSIRGLGDWVAADDAGTKYICHSISVGGHKHLHLYQVSFSPTPPPGVRSLTLTVTTDSGDKLTTTVPLDYAAGPAEGSAE